MDADIQDFEPQVIMIYKLPVNPIHENRHLQEFHKFAVKEKPLSQNTIHFS